MACAFQIPELGPSRVAFRFKAKSADWAETAGLTLAIVVINMLARSERRHTKSQVAASKL